MLGHAFAYTIAAIAQKGLGFVLFFWLAATLSVEAYAQFGLFFALQALVAAFVGAGTVDAIVGRLKHYPDGIKRHRIMSAGNGMFTLMACAGLLLVFGASDWLRQETGASSRDIALLAIIGVFGGFYSLQARLVRLDERHLASLVLTNAPTFVAFVGGLAGFLLAGTLTGFFFGMAIGLAVSFPAFFKLYIDLRRAFSAPKLIGEIARKILPFIVIALVAWLAGYGSTYLINSFFGTTEVSRFTFAYTLSSLMQLLATSLNQVWSPRFFRIVHSTEIVEIERASRNFFTVQALILGAVGGCILAVAPSAIALTGERLQPYSEMSLEMLLLFAAYAVSIPWYYAHNYFYAHACGRELMWLILSASAAGLVFWFAAIWIFGAIGAYLGFAVQMLARSLIVWVYARRLWRVSFLGGSTFLALLLMAAGTLAGEQLLRILALS